MKKFVNTLMTAVVLMSSGAAFAAANPNDPNDIMTSAGRRHLAETRSTTACKFSKEGNFTNRPAQAPAEASTGTVSVSRTMRGGKRVQ
jgi:hypothetical protein